MNFYNAPYFITGYVMYGSTMMVNGTGIDCSFVHCIQFVESINWQGTISPDGDDIYSNKLKILKVDYEWLKKICI